MNYLTVNDLGALIRTVFPPRSDDKNLAILIDIPDIVYPDHVLWQKRRILANDWGQKLRKIRKQLKLENVDLILYSNVHNNNADLPKTAYPVQTISEPINADTIAHLYEGRDFRQLLAHYQLILAPTQFSATAPLKILAKKHGFRAATMPGFSEDMIPALKLDYNEINKRVAKIKNLVDAAIGLNIRFKVNKNQSYSIYFDLRFRKAHASGGRFPEPGTAGNLPSGECYIVPYEGENKESSKSEGILPVQFEEEMVLYKIYKNRAIDILSDGPVSKNEKIKIIQESAYANIAEIGFGVLKKFGIKPTGKILLDEKLGLHIAFGRSDHFGGIIGVKDFSSPDKVEHTDRLYLPEIQSLIQVESVDLHNSDGCVVNIMKHNTYQII